MHNIDSKAYLSPGNYANRQDHWCAGKFYTLATGANERRWSKMKPRLEQVVQSFEVQNRYDAAPIG